MTSSGMPRAELIKLSLKYSDMLEKKLIFKLLRSNVIFVDVTFEEARNTFAQPVRCESIASIGRTKLFPQSVIPTWQRNTSASSRRGEPCWERTDFCTLGSRGDQGLAPDLVGETTKGEYKPGLFFVLATVEGFEKPWSILIDSGARSIMFDVVSLKRVSNMLRC